MKLERSDIPLVSHVEPDPITPEAIAPFDLTMDEVTVFHPWLMPELPDDFNILLIVGSSGSGKSLLLKQFPGAQVSGKAYHPFRSIVAHFYSAQEAQERMYAVGLNSVPKWKLPITALSNGEQHRAMVARELHDGGVVDEFTSVVDRNVARSLATAVSKHIRKKGIKRMVFATCHRDIIPFLKPDLIIDTDAGEFYDKNTEEKAGWWWSEYIKGDYSVGTINYEVGVHSLGD